ncbi:MAG TPA: von Willebrand factor type A domain-containing protein [Candidatus Limnocylindrales bacterium]|nr:von Willebrand factor type A domain-containing protein [Candidatus Limnocylindrales bacterium]
MNTDFPTDPREALETSLTALVLGELPPDQAAFLRDAIARDPELARRFERLNQTIDLVRATARTPAELSPNPALKLSQQRREQLLQHFKTIAPKEFGEKLRPKASWLIPVSIAASLVAVCGYLLLPALSKPKLKGTLSARVENRDQLREKSAARFAGALPNDSEKKVDEQLEESIKGIRDTMKKSAPVSLTLPTEAAPRSESKIFLPPATEVAQAQRPSPAAEPNAPALNYDKYTRYQYSGQVPSNDPSTGLSWTAVSGGGIGGYAGFGGGAPVASTAISGDAAGATEAFRRSYGLEAGKELKTPRGDDLAKNESALAGDPFTGLPGQSANWPDAAPTGSSDSSVGRDLLALKLPEINDTATKRVETDAERLKDSKGNGQVATGSRAFYDADGKAINDPAASELRDHFDQAFTYAKPESQMEQVDLSYRLRTNITVQGLGEVPPTMLAEIDLEKELLGRDLGRKPGERSFGVAPALQPQIDSPNQVIAKLDRKATNGNESIRLYKAKRELDERIKQRQNLYLSTSVTSSLKTGALSSGGIDAIREPIMEQLVEQHARIEGQLKALEIKREAAASDDSAPKTVVPPPIPQPEIQARENAFSTFSLNVSDVSFKLAAASLEKGAMPDPAGIRVEEFINAFDYRDPEPGPGIPIGFTSERSQYPFAHNRDLLRLSLKTAAQGRQAGQRLNLVLLLDNSGSMERADRVRIIQEALRVLATQLQPKDTFSVVTFARAARLWVDGIPGNQAGKVAEEIGGLTPQGGTNLEEAMNLAYQTALRHYLPGGVNRVVLLTDGAANLGNVEPEILKQKVEANRKQGIALDCFGIGWEGYNDDLLEALTRSGDGRYGFINTPEEAATGFANQLAGALHVAAADVKVQVEFNPNRVAAYRQLGYARHQLTKEQFRDNTVDAAEIGAAEAGNALYILEVNPNGEGPLATVRVRYKVPGTSEFHEHEWPVPYTGNAAPLQQSSPALRLAGAASAFAELLATSPYAAEVSPDALLAYLNGIPEIYGADARPKTLEWMIRQAKNLAGK